jgi:hypothetical protein
MIKPSDDFVYFFVVICAVLFLLGVFILAFTIPVGASSGVSLTPGHIRADSCADSAVMPIINWTAKGWMQIIKLEQLGNCVLSGKWDKSVPGLYCTGIGTLDGQDWVPDECITIKPNKIVKKKVMNVFKYRYP